MLYRYYVHNKTRRTWCLIDSNDLLEVGQTVLVDFDNEDVPERCECEIIRIIRGLTN